MSKVITAIYEQGVLHPLAPLKLQEHQRVQLHVLPELTRDTPEHIIQSKPLSEIIIEGR